MKARAGIVLLAVLALCSALSGAPRHKKDHASPALDEILTRMDEASKNLKTVSANLEYTKVTVVVNDRKGGSR